VSRAGAYRPILSGESLTVLLALPPKRQRALANTFFELSRNPHQLGDYTTSDESGRALHYVLVDDWIIGFWADHAARELRITEIDAAHP
jgi:hypothetical protein